MPDLDLLANAVITGNRTEARRLAELAIGASVSAQAVLDTLTGAMDEVGRQCGCGEAYVPEMLVAARAMKEAMGVLEPVLVQAGFTPERTVMIGTVQGDLHDIGKNLVAMMWRGANFRVVDLGVNVSAAGFVSGAQKHRPEVIGISALLTTTMPAMRQTVEALKQAGVTARIVVGGAPVSASFATGIGADGFAADAAEAVELVRRLGAA